MPELPAARAERLGKELPAELARLLSFRTELGDFYEAALAADSSHPRQLANWTVNDLIGALGDRDPANVSLAPADFAKLVTAVADKQISAAAARSALPGLLDDGDVQEVLAGAAAPEADELGGIVDRAIADNAEAVEKIRAGKQQAIGAIVGAVMRETKGRADGGEVQRLIREKLGP
jgi:aspartyl-tRNA(Asn)/glutamyl-tRNA(Gln) amidotransferase subunit B